ncbi:MAG: DUF1573 domain-containing protein [Cyclobacteriaceae bacterium]
MKHIISFFISILIFSGAFAQDSATPTLDGPSIKWDNPNFDFGDLTQGERVENTFKFTNTGTAPLIITNVEVTCGCTTPKGWPRDPIPPGGHGELTVAFNSVGKYGRQNKVVKVISNAVSPNNQIVFTANVLTKE